MSKVFNLTSQNKPPKTLLVLTWALFIMVPVLSLPFILNIILEQGEKYLPDEAKLELAEEMECFVNDLEPAVFLNRKIQLALKDLQKAGVVKNGKLTQTGNLFKPKLQKLIGAPVSGLIWHDNKMNDWIFELGTEWQKNPAKYALKKLLQSSLHWQKRSHLRFDKDRIKGFKKQLLGDLTDIPLIEGQISAIISKDPGNGRIYVFYKNLSYNQKQHGGVLIVIREQDLKAEFLLNSVAAEPLKKGLKRSWQYITGKKNQQLLALRRKKTLFSFVTDRRGTHLNSRPGQNFLSFMIFGGRPVKAANNGNVFLTATRERSKLLHPLRPWLDKFYFILKIYLLVGSAVFFYIFLFGFASRADIGKKILGGLIGVAFLPFCLLAMALLLNWQLKQAYNLNTAQQQLEIARLSFNAMIRGHRLELKSRFWQVLRKLDETNGSADELKQKLKETLGDFPAREIMGISADREQFEANFTARSQNMFSLNEKQAMKLTGMRIRNSAYSDAVNRKYGTTYLDGLMGNEWVIGDFMANSRRFLRTKVGTNEFLFTGGALTNRKNDKTISIIVRCPLDLLINDFFARGNGELQKILNDSKPWQLHGIALEADESIYPETGKVVWKTSESSKLAFIDNQTRVPTQSSQISWQEEHGNQTRLLIIFPLADLNCNVCLWVNVPGAAFPVSLWLFIALFLVALFAFTRQMLKQSFQIPILVFAQHAREIQKGNYPTEIGVNGEDEIGALGGAFDEMIAGLKQRDELASYVSNEVMETVKKEDADSLKPGGEMLNAAVAFLSLKGFSGWARQHNSESSVMVLNSFLDTSNKIANQQGGSLDKIIEDTLMLVFRQKKNENDYCLRAMRAVLQIQQELPQKLKEIYDCENYPLCSVGFSVGRVLSGKIGSSSGTLDFSVIGNTVNLAARLKSFADSAKKTGIIVCPQTVKTLARDVRFRFIDRVPVKGRTRKFAIFTALELR
jgi:class 3 adenylate cyclase